MKPVRWKFMDLRRVGAAAALSLMGLGVHGHAAEPCTVEHSIVQQKAGAPDTPTPIQIAGAATTDKVCPINLATALQLADARPFVIELAGARVQIAAAQLQRANVLWLPNMNFGMDYFRHDGGIQAFTGDTISNSRQTMLFGGGPAATFFVTDAIFSPLASRRVVQAQQAAVQVAKNDVLLDVARAYFNLQQARGVLAGTLESITQAEELVRRLKILAGGLAAPSEVYRASTTLENFKQLSYTQRANWRTASADLVFLLRLDATTLLEPVEPPQLQVTLIDPETSVDELIPIGLASRPELAQISALVQAAGRRVQQERLRPAIPLIQVSGASATNSPNFMGGTLGSGMNGSLRDFQGRYDADVQVVWQLQNLGFGNRANVNERRAEQRVQTIELARQSQAVSAEIVQARALVEAALARVGAAEKELKNAVESLKLNFVGMEETTRFGDILQPITRAQEVNSALQQLQVAYSDYFTSMNDYNRSQFQLYRALGYPAEMVTQQGLGACPPNSETAK